MIANGFEAIVAQTVTDGRALAESLMTATVRISYHSGDTTQDPSTGTEVPVYTQRFVSPAKVQLRNVQASQQQVGGRTATTVSVELHLPIDAAAVFVDDMAEVLASPLDSQLVGRKFRVVGPVAKSYATARRIEVEEVVA